MFFLCEYIENETDYVTLRSSKYPRLQQKSVKSTFVNLTLFLFLQLVFIIAK